MGGFLLKLRAFECVAFDPMKGRTDALTFRLLSRSRIAAGRGGHEV